MTPEIIEKSSQPPVVLVGATHLNIDHVGRDRRRVADQDGIDDGAAPEVVIYCLDCEVGVCPLASRARVDSIQLLLRERERGKWRERERERELK